MLGEGGRLCAARGSKLWFEQCSGTEVACMSYDCSAILYNIFQVSQMLNLLGY